MRIRGVILPGVGFLALLSFVPWPARACPPRSAAVYYGPPARAVYYAPPPVAYYPPPTLYPPPVYQTGAPSPYGFASRPAADRVRQGTRVAVGLYDNYFEPASVTVLPGTTVTWTNRGRHKHTVTSDAGQFDSGELGPGGTYSVTFPRAGTFPYHCTLHAQEMRATIVVR